MNMLSVLALASCEKLINHLICSDTLTQDALGELNGKTLCLSIQQPQITLNILFCQDHIRFEPTRQPIFEFDEINQADCTLQVDNLIHLLNLIKNPLGNLPIQGDHRVVMQAKTLFENFEPDCWEKIESIFGYQASSYLHLFSQELSPIIQPIKRSLQESTEQLFASLSPKTDVLDEEIVIKKQQLLQLQSDIEREQYRLESLQNKIKELDRDKD